MGCANEVVVAAADEASARRAIEAATAEVRRVEIKYSRYRTDSVISQINASAGNDRPVICDEETKILLNLAGELHRQSDGLFDATSGVLRRVWDFSTAQLPAQQDLEPLLDLVGWQRVERSGDNVRLPVAGMQLDFGGFGKEYASDRAAAVLRKLGVSHGYVNLGGDFCVVGPQPGDQPWLIGVGNPRQDGAIVAKIPVSHGAIATSGDSVKYFEIDGRRYCHILNPKTGMPVNFWAQTTVRARTALMAGAISTIAMLKEKAAIDFLKNSNTPYLFVDLCGQFHSNQHLAQAA